MSNDYTLAYGTHATPAEGRCAMEWVSYLAGEPHGDDPACVSPVLRAFCTTLNDSLEDAPRQGLRPYLARTIGTAEDGLDEARSWMALDWLIRTYAPRWLSGAGLAEPADRLAGLPPLAGAADLHRALAPLSGARRTVRASWSSGVGGARAAAWTPWGAAGRSAARESAWKSTGAAAWAAARVAVGDIEGDRARAMARDIGGDAAAIMARSGRARAERVGWPARSPGASVAAGRTAAREAARTALTPVLEELRRSSFALLDRMLPTEPLSVPVVADAHLVWGAQMAKR